MHAVRRFHISRSRTVLLFAIVFAALAVMVPVADPAAAQESTPEALENETGGTPVATPAASPAASPVASPQASPQASVPNQLGNVLVSWDVDELPQAPVTVRLLRITLDPGASVPAHFHPGPEFNLVESGTLTANIDGDAATGTGAESAPISESQAVTPGNWIVYPAGTAHSPTNDGTEPLVVLALVILPVGAETESTITYVDGDPAPEELAGVSFVVLGDGLIQQLPAGAGTVIVDQLAVAAGSPVPGWSGPALLSKTSGAFAVAADEGTMQVTRTASPNLAPNAIPGQEFVLDDNDAAFFPAGYDAIDRTASEGGVIFTRMVLDPEGELADASASIVAIQAEVGAEQPDETATGDGLGVGAVVAMNEDGVRVRTEASTSAGIVESYPAGTQFQIVGGPTDAEDFTWYQVVGVGDLADVAGWFPSSFMDVVTPATGEVQAAVDDGSGGTDETAAADPETDDVDVTGVTESILGDLEGALDAEPAAEPAGEPVGEASAVADITAGATVVTIDTNVRVRAEPSATADILAALPVSTELTIVSGPTEADGLSWFEVETSDGTSGWVAADFLQVTE